MLCQVCGSDAFTQDDEGLLVCDDCGVQSQEHRVEVAEDDGGGGRTVHHQS